MKHKIAWTTPLLLALLATISITAYTLYTPKTSNSLDMLSADTLPATGGNADGQALLSMLETLEKLNADNLAAKNISSCRVVARLLELLEKSVKVYIEELERYSEIAENLDNLALMASYNLKRYGGTLTVHVGSSGKVTVTVARGTMEEIVAALKLINETAAIKAMYVEMLETRAEEIARLAQTLASLYTYCREG